MIEDMGGSVLDCDRVYYQMLDENEAMRSEIRRAFRGVFTTDGTLDRKKLGAEVFSNKDRLSQLNAIIYRHLLPVLEERITSE